MSEEQERLLADRYRILSEIGSGGMAQVVKCDDTVLRRPVAVKILSDYTSEANLVRFQNEARAAASLEHPNIAKVLDFGTLEGDRMFLAMDYCDGESLKTLIEREGPLDFLTARPILAQVCRGLSFSHEHGILHRDVKPSNVMLVEASEGFLVKIVDFGVAKVSGEDQRLTRTGAIVGSPPYISPEAVQAQELSAESDIYSFGCLMFEVLTGQPPLSGSTALDTMMMHVSHAPPTLAEASGREFDEHVEMVVGTCLEKKKRDRFASFDQVVEALEQFSELSENQSPEGDDQQRNRSIRAGLLFALVLLIVAGTTILVSLRQIKNKSPEQTSKVDLNEIDSFPDLESEKPVLKRDSGAYWLIAGHVKGDNLSSINDWSGVRSLRFKYDKLGGQALAPIRNLDLVELELYDSTIDDDSFSQLSRIRSLEKLSLRKSYGITAAGLAKLTSLPELKSLSLSATAVNDDCIGALINYPALEALTLKDCSMLTPRTWSQLLQMGNLTSLYFGNTALDRSDLKQLRGFAELRGIEITKVSAERTQLLGTLPIVFLSVYGNPQVTDRELLQLARIGSLKELKISKCPLVSVSFKQEFEKIKPDCEVEHWTKGTEREEIW